ncbi:MAG: hypothetical protein WC365_03470 [Candidatus Babeliales bacterium]|jgi:hypothetical protein
MKIGATAIVVVSLVITTSAFAVNIEKVLLTSEGIRGYKSVLEKYREINTKPQMHPGSSGIFGAFSAMRWTPQRATVIELATEIKNLTPNKETPLGIFDRIIGIIADDFRALSNRSETTDSEFVESFMKLNDDQQEKVIAIMTDKGLGLVAKLQAARSPKNDAPVPVE